MLRPSTRSSSRKFGQNTRHSSKKSPYALKKENNRATLQIKRGIFRKSIRKSSSITSKANLSIPLSKGNGLSNKLNGSIDVSKTSLSRLRSRSETILETPIPQLMRRNTLRKCFPDESPLSIRKGVVEIEQSFSKDVKRITRSGMSNIDDRNLNENRSHESRLAISPLPKSTENPIKCKTPVKVKEINMTTQESKRMTRSSIGKVACNTFSKSKCSKDKLLTLQRSAEKYVKRKKTHNIKSKTTAEIKEMNMISVESKRMTRSSIDKVACDSFLKRKSCKDKSMNVERSTGKCIERKKTSKEKEANVIIDNTKYAACSIGSVTVSSSLKNTLKDHHRTSSMLKNIESPVNSKHMAPSGFQTPVTKKTPECTIFGSPSLFAQAGVGRKKGAKDAVIIQTGSEQTKRRSLDTALPSLRSAGRKSVKQCKTRNAPSASVGGKRAAQMKSDELTFVALKHNTRTSDSGSLSVRELPKRNCKSSLVSKGQKRKPTTSPEEYKRKKKATKKTPNDDEDCIPFDCLTMHISNKRPRRHTVDICIKNKKAPNPSTMLQNIKKSSSTKRKTKPPKPRKDKGTSNAIASAPDISELSIDCLSTFRSETRNGKKRPHSAPVAMKRKSKVAGLRTPLPKKGTLKRQRWMFNALKEKNEGHEDDIFENKKFQTPLYRVFNEADDESDSSISTPKFGFVLTPAVPKKTPSYKAFKEAISASDLLLARKNAEEYLYRRNKKRTSGHSMLTSSFQSQTSVAACDEVPEKKRLEFAEVMEKVATICKDLEEKSGSEDED